MFPNTVLCLSVFLFDHGDSRVVDLINTFRLSDIFLCNSLLNFSQLSDKI